MPKRSSSHPFRLLFPLFAVPLAVLGVLPACGGEGGANGPWSVPVVGEGPGSSAVLTAEGWEVELARFAVGGEDLTFHAEAAPVASLLDPLSRLLIPQAHAHPGHGEGGEVLGELAGPFTLRSDGASTLGEATLYPGTFSSAAFSFAALDEEEDALADGETPSAVLEGTASRDGVAVPFVARIVQDEGRRVDGVPFSWSLDEESPRGRIAFELLVEDAYSAATLFDGIAFALPEGGEAMLIDPGSAEHNRLRNALQSHVFWVATHRL